MGDDQLGRRATMMYQGYGMGGGGWLVMTVILLLLGGALVVYLNRLSRDHSRTAEETSVRGQSEMRTHGLAMLRSRRKASKNAPAP